MDLRERPDRIAARHPWETTRAAFFARLLRGVVGHGSAVRVLDLGAGDGYVARHLLAVLPEGSRIECCDAYYSDDLLARLRAESPCLTFTRAPSPARFDVVVMLDVLEHVPDDVRFLSEVAQSALRPRGVVLVSTPAHGALFTRHDVALGHYRRYAARQLRHVVEAAGLQVVSSGGLFHTLLLPRAAAKLLELARGISSEPDPSKAASHAETELGRWRAGRRVTAAVEAALRLDNGVSRAAAALHLQLPGLSCWALARA